ncbi:MULTISPECIES: TetR/AcrR family transcriptional regulator [unclassified Paenibacillus]|uniref:TetR/AcrR family transcriptional regulator n=1 Tax=unclassified Paenibacillus TaxID=185978 RepID=UPI002786D436|nr:MULTISPECIES: TetR/AcrR family transcriptional regulator [unclassified Paenibacillus]MDQ0899080.1 AcrR family transcriptional regulator [Paenibacillus sp. V4I7]MDQ0914937.1 AcrR family transcriptional regulator [Paenibacillus sp. V4I5]
MVVREDRKEQIMDKAVGIFAELGYYKATTALVAKAAGVTQPYVFHFFKNKEELFNAVIDRAVSRIYETFSQVEAPADQLMHTIGHAFMQIMYAHRDEIIMVMQSHAISEPVIREHVREKFKIILTSIVAKFENAGIPNAEAAASQFFGMGFLITVSEVLDLPEMLCFKD